MNILDIENKIKIKNWDQLLKYAKMQFLEYEKIEGIEDWDDYCFSIDYSKDQLKLKDMLEIRFIEELTEATLARYNLDHFQEEIIDSFNFYISALIMLNMEHKLKSIDSFLENKNDIKIPDENTLFYKTYQIVEATGSLCNLLKNRPWSQSNYLVSLHDFNHRLYILHNLYGKYLNFLGFSKEKLFDLFSKKLSVNLFRMNSSY